MKDLLRQTAVSGFRVGVISSAAFCTVAFGLLGTEPGWVGFGATLLVGAIAYSVIGRWVAAGAESLGAEIEKSAMQ